MRNANEELIKLFKQKYKLTEEQSDEIISIVKANADNRLNDRRIECMTIADKLNTKYSGKIVYLNQYEAGGWICNCRRVIYDINMDCFRFEGSRFVLLSENEHIGDGYAFVRDEADNGAEYDFDIDDEDVLEFIDAELEILESIDDVKEILEDINECSLDEF